jgi:NAD-dependent dihydropyrimidine dehydrogenase PreA subunit
VDAQGQEGLLGTWRGPLGARGPLAWALALGLSSFYVALYFEDELGHALGLRPFTALADAVGLGDRWFLYGALYSLAMIGGAVRYLREHGNARYHQVRIAVNVAVQVVLGFALPFAMRLSGAREFYFSYLWPLRLEALDPAQLALHPAAFAVYSILAALVAVPLLTLRFGKRWYCSWVCGCGGLANTFGDPFRHLTSTSARSWRFERVSVHAVLALAVLTTLLVTLDFFLGAALPGLHAIAGPLRRAYGFVVGAVLAGVIGVGVYPLLGPRVWCRNFCPMAALLGLVQQAGRFRIRVKEDACIACGNCSAYCEMGIDVRAYAERGESFTRAACVGCGMCAHVCPRGVLKLENAPPKRRLPVLG